jgi:hypothetical protein
VRDGDGAGRVGEDPPAHLPAEAPASRQMRAQGAASRRLPRQ